MTKSNRKNPRSQLFWQEITDIYVDTIKNVSFCIFADHDFV